MLRARGADRRSAARRRRHAGRVHHARRDAQHAGGGCFFIDLPPSPTRDAQPPRRRSCRAVFPARARARPSPMCRPSCGRASRRRRGRDIRRARPRRSRHAPRPGAPMPRATGATAFIPASLRDASCAAIMVAAPSPLRRPTLFVQPDLRAPRASLRGGAPETRPRLRAAPAGGRRRLVPLGAPVALLLLVSRARASPCAVALKLAPRTLRLRRARPAAGVAASAMDIARNIAFPRATLCGGRGGHAPGRRGPTPPASRPDSRPDSRPAWDRRSAAAASSSPRSWRPRPRGSGSRRSRRVAWGPWGMPSCTMPPAPMRRGAGRRAAARAVLPCRPPARPADGGPGGRGSAPSSSPCRG